MILNHAAEQQNWHPKTNTMNARLHEYYIRYCVVLAAVSDAIFVVTAVVVDVCNDHKFFT